MSVPEKCANQITQAYRMMARDVHYRPAAPGDGLGNVTVPASKLDLESEALAYAEHWWAEEDANVFTVGCPDFRDRKAMIYAVEAARLCCAGFGSRPYARRLLTMALRELS